MKVKIYQIVPELDEQHLMFRDFESIDSACNHRIPAEIYECVFNGDLDVSNPEEVFTRFNLALPEDYKGRSLSMSDVVEFEQPKRESLFFFCDTTVFKVVAFEKNRTISSRHSNEKLKEKNYGQTFTNNS